MKLIEPIRLYQNYPRFFTDGVVSGVVTRQRKRYTCWHKRCNYSIYTFRVTIRIRESHSVQNLAAISNGNSIILLSIVETRQRENALFARDQSEELLVSIYKEYAFQSWRIFSTHGADSRLLTSTRAQWPCVFPETKFSSLTLIYDEREWKFDFPRSDYARFPLKS